MFMQVILTTEIEHIVQSYLDTGKYQNPEDVLLAGLQLLQRNEMSFGVLHEHDEFMPLTEAEMIQASLQVLEDHRHNGIPHTEVAAWANSLGENPQ
jgi:Arc/MetJ-type ribon-helix-helix transcriptional regulator